ncbi:MAG: glycosyltransferase family 4 protein [Nitrospina sp.]|jgi:UDP-glucose:(heptosyl)LPS alpha-1,3-glucosyltransferase|nr:glycosyltransferase family 4 protein [Nitrospina sp.]MBT4556985.1 glycosyltransferase family 4 protein [Nitrospina sp.]MBT6409861.1 glycosyltransferase family 4 protein [Nitrospina sp.]MBT7196250.1 glycosyltransferase family 4 protein [Nitrospina sp.]MBT7680584.1 glycosyltransferase family 4 protein [Nitrospina sp.]
MKIAIIRQKFVLYGGAEQFVQGYIHQLAEAGHDIHIFANQWTPSSHPNIHLHHVPSFKFNAFIRTLSFAWFSARAVKNKSFDIIQSHEKTWKQDVYRAGDGCHKEWLEQRKRFLPALKRFSLSFNPFHWLILKLEKTMFESGQCKKFIAISQMVKNDILKHYRCPQENISVVYNGVNLKRFHPGNENRQSIRKELGITESTVLILFVGSGFERKGLKHLLQATQYLRSEDWRLVIMGKGKWNKYLQFAPKNLRSRIIHREPVPEIEKYYSAADLFALPSIYEPFGNANLEALATGLPVITSRHCGAADIIQHRLNGLIVENPESPKEIADNINTLFDPVLRQSMSQNARTLAEQFSLEKNTREMLKTYQEVISSQGK